MPTVVIRHPATPHALTRSLEPGEALLVGRNPDVARAGAALDGWSTGTLTLDDDAVSSNHCLLWCAHDGVWAQDLRSRNGTWLRLSTHPVALAGAELRVDLAGLHGAPTAAEGPFPRAAWTGRDDFARCVADAIDAWLKDLGVDIRAHRVARGDAPGGLRFALATGDELELRASGTGTVDLRLPALAESVAAFVETQNGLVEQESGHDADFILRSPAFREAHRRVWEASVRGRRLLLLGASGTGKECLARCYHRHSERGDGPFKAVNCALVDEGLIYAQLFGAQRGAFTGATHDLKGAVEVAHGGTLFLDEVAELDPRTQASLLRFLDQRGEYERLGDPRPRHADVRIVCATNRDLRAEVRAGRFRDDLWYRFAAAVVDVPPLRNRPEDVLAFLAARRVSRTLTAWEALSPEARSFASSHAWPGNFRELANFVDRLPAVTRPGAIDAATCQRALQEGLIEAAPPPSSAPATPAPWDGLLAEAASSWREDHQGADPETLGDIKDFVESYLKPVFAARASGVAQGVAVSDLNWSALGRRLAVADGTTVKRWVERYLARFRRG